MLTEAIRFSKDFDLKIQIEDEIISLISSDNDIIEQRFVKQFMKRKGEAGFISAILNCTWQWLSYQSRVNDEHLVKSACYNWLTKWKHADVCTYY